MDGFQIIGPYAPKHRRRRRKTRKLISRQVDAWIEKFLGRLGFIKLARIDHVHEVKITYWPSWMPEDNVSDQVRWFFVCGDSSCELDSHSYECIDEEMFIEEIISDCLLLKV